MLLRLRLIIDSGGWDGLKGVGGLVIEKDTS